MKNSILAVVVTYNRIDLLKRCISFLQSQTLTCDILIINNSSSDGTEEYLLKNNIDFITQRNLGSAGGWHRAIDEAKKREYKYVWLMDDDGYPDKNAIENLIKNFDSETVCLSSCVVQENSPNEFVFGFPKLNSKRLPVLFSNKRKYLNFNELPNSLNYDFTFLFNGALISLEKIGNENVNVNFFLYGDEVDFFFRLRKIGKVKTILNAIHFHPDVSTRSMDEKRVYYFIRNTIYLNKLYFDHILIRNIMTIGVVLCRVLKRNGLKMFLSFILGKNLKLIYYGINDARKQKLGQRF